MLDVKETDEATLNRAYFLALRTCAARSIPDACARFGVDVDFATQVAQMTMQDIDKLSLSNLVIYKPTIEPSQFLRIAGIEDSNNRHIVTRLSVKH